MENEELGVTPQDTEALASAFIALHTQLVDDEDKVLLMTAFNISKSLIEKYSRDAVASKVESRLLTAKTVQMKLAASNLSRAAKAFKDVSA